MPEKLTPAELAERRELQQKLAMSRKRADVLEAELAALREQLAKRVESTDDVPVGQLREALANERACVVFWQKRAEAAEMQLAAERERRAAIQKQYEIVDREMGVVSYQLERIREHFDAEWNIKGDGKWRVAEIAKCCRIMLEANAESVDKSNELASLAESPPPEGPRSDQEKADGMD